MEPQDGRQPVYGIEEHSIDYIPIRERHGATWRQGPFWFLGDFNFFTLAMGYIGPSVGLSFRATCLASIVGVLFGTLFMALHASQGPDLGVPQMVQSRAQFGYKGVLVPLFAALCTFLGFNIVDSFLISQGMNDLYGWNASRTAVLLTVLVIALAVYGYDWLHRAFQVIFWLGLPFYIVLSVGILNGHIAPQATKTLGFSWVAFSTQFVAAASYNITFAPYVSDYTRYLPRLKSRWPLIVSVYLGASLSSIWLMVIGAWLACYLGATDGLTAINDVGDRLMPHGGVILTSVSILALLAAMSMNAYSGMLTVVTGIDSFRKLKPSKTLKVAVTVSLGLLWYVSAKFIHAETIGVLSNALTLMLYLLVPWTAINLVDYFLVRRGRYAIIDLFQLQGIYNVWAWRGLSSYLFGFVVSIPFFSIPGLFEGTAAKRLGHIDISWLVGLLVSGLLYYILMSRVDLKTEEIAITEARQNSEDRV